MTAPPRKVPAFIDSPAKRRGLRRLETLSLWLDQRYLDPLLGLVAPGIGDTLGSLLGLYGVVVSARLGAHPVLLARMLLNLGIDAAVGGIPLLGAVFDFFYKAHVRNLALLHERGPQGAPRAGDWGLVVAAFLLLLLLAVVLPAAILYLGLTTLSALFSGA